MEYNILFIGVKNLKVRWEFLVSISVVKLKYWNNRDKFVRSKFVKILCFFGCKININFYLFVIILILYLI